MDDIMDDVLSSASDSWEDDDDDELMIDGDIAGVRYEYPRDRQEEGGDVDVTLELELYQMLQNASSHYEGTFAFSSQYSAAPNPGLKVAGLGGSALSLPITPETASALSKLGDVSPFGKGEKTLIDPEVRRSRQLDPSSVELENPAFSEWLNDQVLPEMTKALGISSDMEPKLNLYKLLIYERGDHFKAHRDSPKEDGMIGTVVVVLPSVFEGGVITLTHGDEVKTFDFAPTGKYNTTVAAWYSDVKHAVEEIKSGYRIALVYNLIVGQGSISVKDTAVNSDFLEVLQRFKETTEPVAFILNNKYSLSQRRQGFKGEDRYIVSNVVNAINRVGGISLCCGDLEFRISEDEDEDEDDEDDEDDENCEHSDEDGSETKKVVKKPPPDFSKLKNSSRLTLSNLEHVAGTYRHFTKELIWKGKMYSLGPELVDLSPFNQEEEETGNEGVIFHSWYRTSCIVLWPTSEAKSIMEQTADPSLPWDDFLSIVTKRTAPQEAQLKNQIEFTKAKLLIERCICNPPEDHRVKQAGMLVYTKLQNLPSEFVFEIGEKELLRCANLLAQDIGLVEKPKPSRLGLLRLLKLKTLFPKDIQFSFNRTVNEFLGSRSVGLSPEDILEFLEVYEESSVGMLRQFLHSVFKAHPNVDLLQDVYALATERCPKDSYIRDVLSQALLYEYHEYIIEGIKEHFATSYEKRDLFLIPGFNPELFEYSGLGLTGKEVKTSSTTKPYAKSFKDKLIGYFEFLADLPAPHRARLLSLFYDSMKFPKRQLSNHEDYERNRDMCTRHLTAATEIIKLASANAALEKITGVAALRESVIEAVLVMHPMNKPEAPSYYLPAHTSSGCTHKGSGCSVCGVLNQFLQSNTESEFVIDVNGDEELEHYQLLERELTPHRYMIGRGPAVSYPYDYAISVRYDRPYYGTTGHFEVTKKALRDYKELKEKHDKNIKRRKELFESIGEEMDSHWRIKREIDGSHDIPDMQLD
ncbi:hypothetical protein Dda_6623 [Drechslerella dactyloides]|uniref:Fe2OG dioxygenase domain-containing protein n=1 Tax=Drechslerella dactyloides TaxID=74499 RepID=A0AAD6NHQ1_DREDA|nr:hypothetical protein Dda_6623 [Drechslerella dactyloides]